jgi:hypothetical protein
MLPCFSGVRLGQMLVALRYRVLATRGVLGCSFLMMLCHGVVMRCLTCVVRGSVVVLRCLSMLLIGMVGMSDCLMVMLLGSSGVQPGITLVGVRRRMMATGAVVRRSAMVVVGRGRMLLGLGRMVRRIAAVLLLRGRRVGPQRAVRDGEQQPGEGSHEGETLNEVHR